MKRYDFKNIYGEVPQSFHMTVESTLDGLEEQSEGKYRKGVRAAIIFAAAIAVISVGAVSAGAVFKGFAPVEEGNYGLNIAVDVPSKAENNSEPNSLSLSLDSKSGVPEYVKVSLSYLPEGLVYVEQDGKYRYNGGAGLTLIPRRITEKQDILEYNVDHYDEMEINGNNALIAYTTWSGEENEYTRQFYIYFEDSATLVMAFVANSIPDDELLKIMEGVTVEECSGDDFYALSFTEAKEMYEEEKRDQAITDFTERVSEYTRHNNYYPIKTGTHVTFSDELADTIDDGFGGVDGLTYSIDNIEVLDNISDLDYNKFDDWHIDLENDVDENGNLLPYDRNIYSYGDGMNSPIREVIDTKTVNRRLVYVTATVTNNADSDRNFLFQGFDLGCFEEDGDKLKFTTSGDPDENGLFLTEMAYCDNNNVDEDGIKSGWNFMKVQPGESKTVHFGLFTDDDLLENLYVTFDGGFSSYSYDVNTSEWKPCKSSNLDGTFNNDLLCTKVLP